MLRQFLAREQAKFAPLLGRETVLQGVAPNAVLAGDD